MERKETDMVIGTKITYQEENCRYVLIRDNETGVTESHALVHKDAPLLAPQVIPDPHFNGFVWDFSKVMILDDSDFDVFLQNVDEMRAFVKKIKDIRE